MLLIIFLNTIQLAVDNPLKNPEDKFSKALTLIDFVLTCIFSLEAIMKIIAFGVIYCGSTSYVRNSWNLLDIFVVIVTILSYCI